MGRDLRLQIPDVSPASVAGIFRCSCFSCCFRSVGINFHVLVEVSAFYHQDFNGSIFSLVCCLLCITGAVSSQAFNQWDLYVCFQWPSITGVLYRSLELCSPCPMFRNKLFSCFVFVSLGGLAISLILVPSIMLSVSCSLFIQMYMSALLILRAALFCMTYIL